MQGLDKTLLSKVLDINEPENIVYYIEGKNIRVGTYVFIRDINIYELAHKCKEWCVKQKYSLVSYYSLQSNKWYCLIDVDDGVMFHSDIHQEFCGTEPEAIFLAWQWCYKQVKEK